MSFKIGNIEVKKGEKINTFLPVKETGISLPVTIINGSKDGKVALISGGVHACEYVAIETVKELANEIDASKVSGTIILVHLSNVTGFYKKSVAVVPEDNKNLNRVFPGNCEGTLSEKIAYMMTNELQARADFYLDLHGGDLHELVMPFVYYAGVASCEVVEASCNIAKQLNVNYRVKSSATTGAYNSAAILGTPSILIERGGRGLWDKSEVSLYKEDVYRVLKYFNMLEGNTSEVLQEEITKAIYLDSEYDGYWYPAVKPGEKIKKGQELGTIKDCFGKELKKYISEFDGIVLYMTISLAINSNDSLIAYGELKN